MVMPFKLNSTCLIFMSLVACLFTLPKLAQGQITGHYVAGVEGIKFVYFTELDVVRHRLVQEIIRAYDRASGNPS